MLSYSCSLHIGFIFEVFIYEYYTLGIGLVVAAVGFWKLILSIYTSDSLIFDIFLGIHLHAFDVVRWSRIGSRSVLGK